MKRRAYIIGTVALGLIAAAIQSGPGWHGVVSSAERIQSNFEQLQSNGSLNPVERLVFSIVLTGAEARKAAPTQNPRT